MSRTRAGLVIAVLCALVVGCGVGALTYGLVERHQQERSPGTSPAGTAVGFAYDLASPTTQTHDGVDVDERWIAPDTGWDPTSTQAIEFAEKLWRSGVSDEKGNYYDDGGFLAGVAWGTPPTTYRVDLYSRVTGEPIMTVVTTIVDGKGFMVDWRATVDANKSGPPKALCHAKSAKAC